jgi:exosome complex RNA-binding protein Rrp42 (RNase PH superfamily)
VRSSRVVEMEDLSIEKGKSAWKLMVDVYCADHDGNVADAALVAVMAALKSLRLPAVSISDADHVVSIQPGSFSAVARRSCPARETHLTACVNHDGAEGDSTALRLQHSAFSTSFALVHGSVLLDPTSSEEVEAAAAFTLTYTSDGQLCGVHKAGGSTLEPSALQQCMAVAKARSRELDALVAQQLGGAT